MTVIFSNSISAEQAKKEIRTIDRASRKIAQTPESAREYLIKHGFITKNLKLTKHYSKK